MVGFGKECTVRCPDRRSTWILGDNGGCLHKFVVYHLSWGQNTGMKQDT